MSAETIAAVKMELVRLMPRAGDALRNALPCLPRRARRWRSNPSSAARSRLQVPLETRSLLFGRELEDDHQGPRTVFDGVSAGSMVVPFQPIVDVARQADVMTLRVAVAAKHVDEPLADAGHAVRECTRWATVLLLVRPGNSSKASDDERTVRRFCSSGVQWAWRNLPSRDFPTTRSLRTVRVRIRCGESAYAPPSLVSSYGAASARQTSPVGRSLGEGRRAGLTPLLPA
jgi:hypothetical protein